MTDRHVGTELKAAFSELQDLATRLANSGREWLSNRSEDMNQYRDDQADRDNPRTAGYGQRHGNIGSRGYPSADERYPQERDFRRPAPQVTDDYDDGRYQRSPWQTAGGRQRQTEEASGFRGSTGDMYGPQPGREGGYGTESASDEYSPVPADRSGSRFAGGSIGRGNSYSGRSSYRDEAGMNRSARGSACYSGRSGYRDDENELRGFNPGYQQAGWQGGYAQDFRSEQAGSRARGYGYGRDGQSDDPRYRERQYGYGRDGQASHGGGDEAHAWQAQGDYGYHRGRGPKGYKRSDERISEDLNEKLTDDPLLDASEITVSVRDGVATLQGSVENRWMKHRAEDVADGCSGVSDVRNEIRVRSRQDEPARGARLSAGTTSASTSAAATGASDTGSQKSSASSSGPASGHASSNH